MRYAVNDGLSNTVMHKNNFGRVRTKKGYLICFVGVDGSGKTTHAKSLLSFLMQNGFSCMYFWGAFQLIFSYSFFALTKILGYWKETKKDAYTDPLEFAHERIRQKLGSIWRLFIFIDFQIKVLRIRIFLACKKIVVCDRYAYDILMELQLSQLYNNRFGKLLCRTVPKPSVTFLLDAPQTVVATRRPITIENLSAKREILTNMARIYNFVIVNSANEFLRNRDLIRTTIMLHHRDAFQEVVTKQIEHTLNM